MTLQIKEWNCIKTEFLSNWMVNKIVEILLVNKTNWLLNVQAANSITEETGLGRY